MKNEILIQLLLDSFQIDRLHALQLEFAKACNFIAPIAQKQHCWNRVALHHLTYQSLRKKFPNLGSQMACNAVYSVCRAYRLLLTHKDSPLCGGKILEGQLPLIHFLHESPVFFDRHTLSVFENTLSLFTMQGRIRFGISISDDDFIQLKNNKLREVILIGSKKEKKYFIKLLFAQESISNYCDVQFEGPDYFVLMDKPNISLDSVNDELMVEKNKRKAF